jgi:desulfoferrodoxin (superoxide reductase-like protein)
MRILVLALIFAALAVPAAYAHPPSLVDLSLTDAGKVQVVVTHAVGNPKEHYINKIELFVNGVKVEEKEYTSQLGNQQIEVFKVTGLAAGDKVSARAYCNKGGDRGGEMVIEKAGE